MFGHQDSTNNLSAAQSADGILSHPLAPQTTTAPQTMAPTASILSSGQAAGSMLDDDTSAGNFIISDPTTVPSAIAATSHGSALGGLAGTPIIPPTTPPTDTYYKPVEPAHTTVDSAGLIELKQSALHDLTPLLDQLQQTAEEKFRTMMMMIQASDDQTMLAEAFHTAQAIDDKKVKAQALLDVVNEINYFTQQQSGTKL